MYPLLAQAPRSNRGRRAGAKKNQGGFLFRGLPSFCPKDESMDWGGYLGSRREEQETHEAEDPLLKRQARTRPCLTRLGAGCRLRRLEACFQARTRLRLCNRCQGWCLRQLKIRRFSY
jgi:hypothetical protein